jgi:hypothetical protein
MSTPPFGGSLQANFQEPSTPDQTSAPPDNPPQTGASIQQVLGQRKKKPFGPNVRNSGALAAAIARSKKGRPNALKYGG